MRQKSASFSTSKYFQTQFNLQFFLLFYRPATVNILNLNFSQIIIIQLGHKIMCANLYFFML